MNEKELRELDAEIAKIVFGWTEWHFDNGHSRHNYLEKLPNARANQFRKRGFIEAWDVINLQPNYSTDPATAMQVLEKCAKKWVGSVRIKALESTEYFIVSCYHGGSNVAAFSGEGNALPLAICLFAKKLFSK